MKHERGCVDPLFMKRHRITQDTGPTEYADIVLLFNSNLQGSKERLSFHQIKKWTKLEASLAGSEKDGT